MLPKARVVGNPGCYPTSVILGLRPLIEAGWINTARGIVADCKSGVTGAGKEPKRDTHFVEVNENFRAYNLFTHRHTPEVSEHLGLALRISCSPRTCCRWIAAFFRRCTCGSSRLAQARRRRSALPQVLRGAADGSHHAGGNSAGAAARDAHEFLRHRLCARSFRRAAGGRVSCLDNLGKGAAGQAVQNLNGMRGYPETAGLL